MTAQPNYRIVLTRTVTTTVHERVEVTAPSIDAAIAMAATGHVRVDSDELGTTESPWDATLRCPRCGGSTYVAHDEIRECSNQHTCGWNESDDWIDAQPSLIGRSA